MNRLYVRLTLAFILVIFVTVATVAGWTNWSVGNQFRQYLMQPDVGPRRGLIDALGAYYQQHGSWNEVATWLDTTQPFFSGGHRRGGERRTPLLLADAQRHIVYEDGRRPANADLKGSKLQSAQAITVNGQLAGYALLTIPELVAMQPAELDFLARLRVSLRVAALLAGGLGIALGLVISRMLATPLALLAQTARAFAAHDWNQRVRLPNRTTVTEVAEVAQAFNDMADELQQAEIQRRNLMADIAHELRTPLAVIQSNLHALLDGVYPLEMKEIATLYDETRLLARLVDDLRELTLAESGQLPLTLQPLAGGNALRLMASKFAVAADAQTITLVVNVPAALPPVLADSDRMAQVLQNLVSNALRHTPEGGEIRLTADATDKPGFVEFSVQDTGEGIPKAALPFVFDRFYRADQSRARRSGGTGLGLAIAQSLVQTMGGTIGVESVAESVTEQGSRFWFTLPVAGD